MQTIKQTIITLIICLAVVAGMSWVYAWTGPTQAPPGGNVSAPINVGSASQAKTGALSIGGLLQLGSFKMTSGAGSNKVLTSDASGLGSWQTPAGGGGVSGNGTTNYISKWTGSASLGISQIIDNGSKILVGMTSDYGAAKMHVSTPDFSTAGIIWGVGSTPSGFLGVRSGNHALVGASASGGGDLYLRTGNSDRIKIQGADGVIKWFNNSATEVGFLGYNGSNALVGASASGGGDLYLRAQNDTRMIISDTAYVGSSKSENNKVCTKGNGLCGGGGGGALSCIEALSSNACGSLVTTTATCPAGYQVTGGGYAVMSYAGGYHPDISQMSGNAWLIRTWGSNPGGTCWRAIATCCKIQ